MPRLRRLRRARRRAPVPAHAGHPPREHRVRLRHRLLLAVPVLPQHLRHALHPRPRARDRHRPGRHPARPVGVGRHRRRRRAVDRRQPPDPRAAPQREPQDPAVQQPDLRAHQGPVLADVRGGQDHQVDAVSARSTTPSTRSRWRWAPRPRSSGGRIDSDRKGLTAVLQAAAAHRGTALVEIFQDCPIFNDGSFDVLRKADDRAASGSSRSSHGEPIRFGPAGDDGLGTYAVVREGFGLRVAKTIEVDESEIVVHDADRPQPRVRALAAVRPGPHAHGHRHLPQRRPLHLRRRRPRAGPARAREPLARPAGPAQRPRHLDAWRTEPGAGGLRRSERRPTRRRRRLGVAQ